MLPGGASFCIDDEEAFQPVYYSEVKDKCFEGNAHLNLTNTRAMHLNNKVTSMYLNTKAGTPCDEILHRLFYRFLSIGMLF